MVESLRSRATTRLQARVWIWTTGTPLTTKEISDEGFGSITALRLPSGVELALYEPRHPSPLTSGA